MNLKHGGFLTRADRNGGLRRGRAAVAVVIALVMTALVAPAMPASARLIDGDREPIFGDGEQFEMEWAPPVNGFEWYVPSRFGHRVNGMVDYHWDAARAEYAADWVHPTSLQVSFWGCPNEGEDERDGNTDLDYRWELRDANDQGRVLLVEAERRKCSWTRSFALDPQTGRAAPVFVRLAITERATGRPWTGYPTGTTFHQQLVAPRDVLIVSIGDSYGSGEGNPDHPQIINPLGVVEEQAQWIDKRCHRSASAAPAQAALNIELSDPHNTVTFLSFACSGATISKEYWADQPALDPYRERDDSGQEFKKPIGTGVLDRYIGVEHSFTTEDQYQDPDNKLPSQLDQLEHALTDGGARTKRNVDALLLSAGGNDMGFGPLAVVCTLYYECPGHRVMGAHGEGNVPLATRFEASVAAMPERYAGLDEELDARFTIGRTYITQYPDPTSNTKDALCSAILDDVTPPWMQPLLAIGAALERVPMPLPPYQMDRADGTAGKDELAFAAGPVMDGINGAVRAAAQAHSWTLVDGIADESTIPNGKNLFEGHGYCARDSWIRRATDATAMQGPWDNPVVCSPMVALVVAIYAALDQAIGELLRSGCHLPPAVAQTKGTLHPTAQGHTAIAKRMLEFMKPDLIPNPPSSPPQFRDNRGEASHGANGWLIGKGARQSCPQGMARCVPIEVTVSPGTGSGNELRSVSITQNGRPVSCSTTGETANGVTCKKQRSTGEYKWLLTFSADGIYGLEFAAQAVNGAVTTFPQEYKVDLTDPSTATATPTAPRPPIEGWYRDAVDVTFTGQDTAGGSGIDAIEYTINGGAPVVVPHGGTLNVNEGTWTITFRPIDKSGRTGPQQGPLTVRSDRTAPAITCGTADGEWHAADLRVECLARDFGSGITGATGFFLWTSVPAGTETADAPTASQELCDRAGNCATGGPVRGHHIDKQPPSITIVRPAGSYYLGQAVTAAYSCSDGGAGVAAGSCTGPVADGAPLDTTSLGAKQFTVRAADAVGNTGEQTATYNVTRHTTSLTNLGDSTGDYHDEVSVSARLMDTSLSPAVPIVGEKVTFSLGGVTCSAITEATGKAGCALVVDKAAGQAELSVSSPQTDLYEAASLGVPFTVRHEQLTVTYAGPSVVPNGRPTTLSAVLREEDVVTVEGRAVVLTLGDGASAQTCTGTTGRDGVATCIIPEVAQPVGPGLVSAHFAGDEFYEPASSAAATLVFELLSAGPFVIGPQSTGMGDTVTFWSAQWAKANPLPAGDAPPNFRGYAGGATPSPACGQTWSSNPAAAARPPASLPEYVGVVVTDRVTRFGASMEGNGAGIAVVRVDPGYRPDASGTGTGTVVAAYLSC